MLRNPLRYRFGKDSKELGEVAMKTKTLGRTGIEVSIIGLGTIYIGSQPSGYPPRLDEEMGERTIVAALEAGCTLIDTAPLYGGTVSEKIIGNALRNRPDLAAKCTVVTKAGAYREGKDHSFDGILRSVEASLERLGLDRLDLVYIHDAMDVPMADVMSKGGALGALRQLQDEGVVRFIGSASNDPPTNTPYIETGEFDAAVVPDAWSLLNQEAAERILPAAERHNIGISCATPLEVGLLATGPIADVDYGRRDFSQACLDHVGRIQRLCQDYEISLLAAALQWCTRHPQVTTAIPGARTPEEAVENVKAVELEIPEAFWSDLAPLVRHWEKGVHR